MVKVMNSQRYLIKLTRRTRRLAGGSGSTSVALRALRAIVLVWLAFAGWGREARAQEGDPELARQCARVWGLTASEEYWGAVPKDELLIPVYYERDHSDSPSALEIVEALVVEVVDPTAPSTAVPGTVSVEPEPVASDYLLRWVPDEPLDPGATYQATVTGTLPDPPECWVSYQPYTFSFNVTTDSWEDWVNGAEMTLRLTGSGGGFGCCETIGEQCEDTMDCFQCWDRWDQPVVQVLWTGQGLPYLTFSTEALGGPLREVGDVPSYVQVISAGALVAQLTLAGFGEYCVQGTVSGPESEQNSIERCGAFTQEDLEQWTGSSREECRTRVPSTTCTQLPAGMTEVSSLYVLYGSTEDEARAALAAAPYHPTEGCYTLDDPVATPTPTAGTAGASGDDIGFAGTSSAGGATSAPASTAGAGGTQVTPSRDSGAQPAVVGVTDDPSTTDAQAALPAPDAGDSGLGAGAGLPRQTSRAPTSSGDDSSCTLSGWSSPRQSGAAWTIAVTCFLGLLWRRQKWYGRWQRRSLQVTVKKPRACSGPLAAAIPRAGSLG